jgi:hypothetical protein
MPADSLHVGITGTRNPLSGPQSATLGTVLAEVSATAGGPLVLHHGVCQGTDRTAHLIVRQIGGWLIEGHPGRSSDGKSPWRATDIEADCDVLHDVLPYAMRNEDITTACSLIVAAPLHPEDDPRSRRSGTWMTVRMARQRSRDIVIAWPDGAYESIAARGDRHAQ